MGRTIRYRVLAAEPISEESWKKIKSLERAMTDLFTWSCENLGLVPIDREEARWLEFELDSPSDPPVQAEGSTKVARDEWNALLTVRFARWLSELLPDALVKVDDEGDYVLAGNIAFKAEEVGLDEYRVAYRHGYLATKTDPVAIMQLRSAILASKRGVYYRPTPALAYADRAEIAALGIPNSELATLSLDEVADRIRFPWQEQAA